MFAKFSSELDDESVVGCVAAAAVAVVPSTPCGVVGVVVTPFADTVVVVAADAVAPTSTEGVDGTGAAVVVSFAGSAESVAFAIC